MAAPRKILTTLSTDPIFPFIITSRGALNLPAGPAARHPVFKVRQPPRRDCDFITEGRPFGAVQYLQTDARSEQ